MRLYLVRHPPPVIDAGICYGSSDLTVLPEQHVRAAARLHGALPRQAPLFSSPLRRCAEFARVLAQELDCQQVEFDSRLAEMDFGAWEGRNWNDIGRAGIDAWCDDRLAYRPGGGESVLEVAARVEAFYRALRQRDAGQAIVVCHAGTIRMLQACARHRALADIGRHAFENCQTVGYGELRILDID
jgi:alpha-ribazole phosphatase